MLGDIDKTLKPQKSRLFLCKPDKTTIAELSEAYDKQLVSNYGGIDELSFRLPFKIEKNKQFIRNDHVDLLRGHFLIRYENGDTKEYFIITQPKNSLSDGIENKFVQCYLLPYELRNKFVRSYSGVKKLYDEFGTDGVLNDTLLRKTDWTIGYIDSDIASKYRDLNISQQDMLTFVTELANTFDAIIVWNTINKTISFYKNENLGQDKGLSIEYGKYLKAIDEEPDFDNVVTQLYIYGKNGLSINRVNPSGTDFITDFSYYMYPFERDINGNVVKHSNYMTDGLCNAILDYNTLLETKNGEFDSLLSQKTTLQETLTTKQNELQVLQDDLAVIEDNLAIANANGDDTTLIVQNKTAKEQEVTSKQSEINQVNVDITNVDNQIATLQSEIAIENNFTSEQIIERNYYVKEQIWMDNNYFDDNELYVEGKKQLQKMSQPLIKYNIDIVDFLKNVRSQRDWGKLIKGDIITVRYPNFDIDIKAKIININHSEDENSINITIANDKDIKNGFLSIKDLLQKSLSSSTTVDMSKFTWNKSDENESQINNIINNKWDATKREIQAGVNETVDISRKGVIIKDPSDPLKYVVMQHGVIALTLDGGNNWKTAIKPDGIVAEQIFGKLGAFAQLRADQIIVEDDGTETNLNSKIDDAELNANAYTNTQISEANSSISNLQSNIDDMSSDGKLTLAEANVLKISLNQVKKESDDLINVANNLNITTEKTNYFNAINNLDLYLTSNFINKSVYPLDITSTQRTDINTKFEIVQNTKSILINKIVEIREQRAKDYAVGESVLYNNIKITSTHGIEVFDNSNQRVVQIGAVDTSGDNLGDVYGVLATHNDNTLTALTQNGLLRKIPDSKQGTATDTQITTSSTAPSFPTTYHYTDADGYSGDIPKSGSAYLFRTTVNNNITYYTWHQDYTGTVSGYMEKGYSYLTATGSDETGNPTVGYFDDGGAEAANGYPANIGNVVITLPDDFKGKDFIISLSVKGGDPFYYANLDGDSFWFNDMYGGIVLDVVSVDKVNATFEVKGHQYYYHIYSGNQLYKKYHAIQFSYVVVA